MLLGRKDKTQFPATYKEFRLIRTHGRVFGIPPNVDPDGMEAFPIQITHPAVLSAGTLDEMRGLIDEYDPAEIGPKVVGQGEGYDLVRYRDIYHAVPQAAGPVDLDRADDRGRAGVISGTDRAALEEAVKRAAAGTPVEFAGWLPIYEFSGNCGRHPQFTHTGNPPPGYRFVRSGPQPKRVSRLAKRAKVALGEAVIKLATVVAVLRVPFALVRPRRGVTMRARMRVLAALVRLLVLLVRRGCKLWPVLRFLQSRHLLSQLLVGDRQGVVFLTSMPYTYGQNPWVIEVEDPTTLFYPLIQNGHTSGLALADSPYFPILKALLEADHCKAILTHMKSSAEMIATLFGSDLIRRKIVYARLGVPLPTRFQRHDPAPDDEPIHLLFINSWCQIPENFFVRGGLDVLEAFAILRERYPQLRLTMRTSLPLLADHYHQIIESGWVRLVNRFIPAAELAELHAQSHIFLLPAARVHIVSILQAMSYGLAVVASDGWGMEEYLTHERNGLIVRGRYGKTSWADEQAGMLREDYDYTHTADPEVVAGLVEAVSRLVEDQAFRRRLGRTARQDVQTMFTPESWNQGLKTALDLAHGVSETVAGDSSQPVASPARQEQVA
jgi:glycosyltransferase involved in cell wall biosynthesis